MSVAKQALAATVAFLVTGATAAAAQESYRRGDATCSTSLGAVDIVATILALNGESACDNDDCDRDGVIGAADVECATRCLFGACPVPDGAAKVTAVEAVSAAAVAPATVIRLAVANLGPSEASRRVTIGGRDAEIAEEGDDELLVAVPSDLPPGQADVVVSVGDVDGPPIAITIAPPEPVGPPDTFDGMLGLVDEAYGKLLALDVEAAFPRDAASVRSALAQGRADLAAQRSALATDPDLGEADRLALDVAVEQSGAPEMLRALLEELDAVAPSARAEGGLAAPAQPYLAFGKGARTLKIAAGVARGAAQGVARTAVGGIATPILIAIGTGIAINAAAIAVASDPLQPLIFSATYVDSSGNARAYPTAGGIVTFKGAHFDALLTRMEVHSRVVWVGDGVNNPDGSISFPLPDVVGTCGRVRFALLNPGYRSNTVLTAFQPELTTVAPSFGKPDDRISGQTHGASDCFLSTLSFTGVTKDFSTLQFAGAHGFSAAVPLLVPGLYRVGVEVEGIRSAAAEDILFDVRNPFTAVRISCPATLDLGDGELNTARCSIIALEGNPTRPQGTKWVWTSNRPERVSVETSPRFSYTTISALRPGKARIKVAMETAVGERKVLVASDEQEVEVVDRTPPTVTIASSAGGSIQPGATIPVRVTLSDNDRLSIVQLFTTGDAVANGQTQESIDCTDKKTCTVDFTVALKAGDYTQNTVTVQAFAYDKSSRRGASSVLSFAIATDTTCPSLVIESPPSGGSVNAGETVTVVATAHDDGPADTGVRRFVYSATGEALAAPVSQELSFPSPLKAPTLRFNFTVKSAAELAGVEDTTITIAVASADDAMPPNSCGPQTVSVGVVGVLDRCQGGVTVDHSAGYIGDPFTVTVVLAGEGADEITRVTSINPGGQFDLQPQGGGVYAVTLFYQGTGRFTLRFVALDAEGTERCAGSIALESLGPKPGDGQVAAGLAAQPAGAVR